MMTKISFASLLAVPLDGGGEGASPFRRPQRFPVLLPVLMMPRITCRNGRRLPSSFGGLRWRKRWPDGTRREREARALQGLDACQGRRTSALSAKPVPRSSAFALRRCRRPCSDRPILPLPQLPLLSFASHLTPSLLPLPFSHRVEIRPFAYCPSSPCIPSFLRSRRPSHVPRASLCTFQLGCASPPATSASDLMQRHSSSPLKARLAALCSSDPRAPSTWADDVLLLSLRRRFSRLFKACFPSFGTAYCR